ncbi:hypothetical protein H6P87_00951 [Rickettsia tillamookensis]|uniref:Uncharacterized protein n=1 Tax=Rickettsia tillamookensis TaxID=2761623 RepID=A0A9E6MHW3_9RICK|nr:hypothetical protein [Rickettsia tillamookensis]QQV75395.1 hypothetical protein H6P87_00951 [Rickettsia tillamookensis]
MLVSYRGVNPELLAEEVNLMMSRVGPKLDSIANEEGKITYAKQKLLKYFKNNSITKILALKNCFEGTTGETLNIIDIIDDLLLNRDGFHVHTADTLDAIDTLKKTLIPLLGIYFSE